jgi:hypothetical protein
MAQLRFDWERILDMASPVAPVFKRNYIRWTDTHSLSSH